MTLWTNLKRTTVSDILKNYGFSRLWLNINFQKNEKFQKWEKIVSDGIFELAIANLVGFDHLFVKID